ncbi:unnamed protein product [Trichobilharzia regenti]|nr:unnamed protein product [Trichobilharzia regenti]
MNFMLVYEENVQLAKSIFRLWMKWLKHYLHTMDQMFVCISLTLKLQTLSNF